MGRIPIFFVLVLVISYTTASRASDLSVSTASTQKQAFLTPEMILEAWESAYLGINSMEVSYALKVIDTIAPEADPHKHDNLTMVQHIERIEAKKRYHTRYSISEDAFDKPENLMEHAFDGKTTREYWARYELGTISPGLVGRNVETMNHLKLFMLLTPVPGRRNQDGIVDDTPMFSHYLKSGISDNKVVVRPELEKVGGELCHVLEILERESKNKSGRKVWVAHEKGMLPMKYERYKNGVLDILVEVYHIAKAQTETGDIWYPAKAYKTISSSTKGTIKYELETHTFVPNIDIRERSFSFAFPYGTHVANTVYNIDYIEGHEAMALIENDEITPVHKLKPSPTEKVDDSKQGDSTMTTTKEYLPTSESDHRKLDIPVTENYGANDSPVVIESIFTPANLFAIAVIIMIGGVLFALWHRKRTKHMRM